MMDLVMILMKDLVPQELCFMIFKAPLCHHLTHAILSLMSQVVVRCYHSLMHLKVEILVAFSIILAAQTLASKMSSRTITILDIHTLHFSRFVILKQVKSFVGTMVMSTTKL